MEVSKNHEPLPQITEDDLFAMIFRSHDEHWKDLAKEQPELAREIEQFATRVRTHLEDKTISPLEAQRQLINFGVLVVNAMRRALTIRRTDQQPPQST